MKKDSIVRDTLILTVITLIAGLLLGLVYQITKEPIAQQEESAKTEAYKAVFAEADSFEPIVEAEDADIWNRMVFPRVLMRSWKQKMRVEKC